MLVYTRLFKHTCLHTRVSCFPGTVNFLGRAAKPDEFQCPQNTGNRRTVGTRTILSSLPGINKPPSQQPLPALASPTPTISPLTWLLLAYLCRQLWTCVFKGSCRAHQVVCKAPQAWKSEVSGSFWQARGSECSSLRGRSLAEESPGRRWR